MIAADRIDASFVARPRRDIAAVEVDGEMVLAVPFDEHYDTHWLDRVAAVVWSCFDGAATLGEIAADLSEATGADAAIVASDVVELARTLGRGGLFDGVEPDRPTPVVLPLPESITPGEPLPEFTATTGDGARVTSATLRGRRYVLVNWSERCGHCRKIAPELAESQPALARAGVDLVLVAAGNVDENQRLLEGAGLTCMLLFADDVAAFRNIGTPCAYLVDPGGRVESGLALGSLQVPALVRELGA